MVNRVPKGAGRAAATARTNRHAQRTPLPPKAGKIEDAKEVLEAAGVGKKTRAKKTAAALAVSSAPAPDSTPATPAVFAKAAAFANYVEAAGWTVERQAEGEHATVIAARDDETIRLEWEGTRYIYPGSYAYGGRTMQVRNASQGRQLADRSPEDAAKEFARVSNVRRIGGGNGTPKPRAGLPFDVDLALDDEVISALRGKDVMWINSVSKVEDIATIPRDEHSKVHISVDGEERRVINFCCPIGGYRSVRVESIVDVGPAGTFWGRRKRRTGGDED